MPLSVNPLLDGDGFVPFVTASRVLGDDSESNAPDGISCSIEGLVHDGLGPIHAETAYTSLSGAKEWPAKVLCKTPASIGKSANGT